MTLYWKFFLVMFYFGIANCQSPGLTGYRAVKRSNNSLELTWDAYLNTTQYQCIIVIPSYTAQKTNTTSITIANLKANTEYSVTCQVFLLNGITPQSSIAQAGTFNTTSGSTIYVLNNLVASPSNISSKVALTWDAVANATLYQITYVNGSNISAMAAVTISNLATLTTYTFKVMVLEINGVAPTGLQTSNNEITLTTGGHINLKVVTAKTHAMLTWDAVTGATEYQVTYDNGTTINAAGSSGMSKTNITTATITALVASTTYTFKVMVVNISGPTINGQLSYTPVTETTKGDIMNFVVKPGSTTADLTWDAIKDATQYQVTYINGTDITAVGTMKQTSSIHSAKISNLVTSTNYTFKVTVVKLASNEYKGEIISSDPVTKETTADKSAGYRDVPSKYQALVVTMALFWFVLRI